VPPDVVQTYAARRSTFEKTTVWRLHEAAMEIATEGTEPIRLAYADILRMRLTYDPTRLSDVRHRCEVTARDGRRFRIVSATYVRLATFESQAAVYVPFVRSLAARIAAANPQAAFLTGKSPPVYYAEQAILAALVVILAVVLFTIGLPLSDLLFVKLILIATLVPFAVKYAVRNRPGRFDPQAIPDAVLPR
jgi:hypothetical protein